MSPSFLLVRRVSVALAIGAVTWMGPARAGDGAFADGRAGTEPATPAIVLTPAERGDFLVAALILDGTRASDPRVRALAVVSQAFPDERLSPAAQRATVDTLAEEAFRPIRSCCRCWSSCAATTD